MAVTASGRIISTDYSREMDADDAIVDWHTACWDIIGAYFNEHGLVKQQLNSFNEFISVGVQTVVKDVPAIEAESASQ